MDNKVFLSIVIPMFNAEKTIIKALDSLNNQTDKDIELILVDDGSTDDSYEISKSYLESKDFNYDILRTENYGQSKARNLGIDKAIGEYVLFLDSDDYVDSKLVEVIREASNRSHPEIVSFDYKRVNADYTIRNSTEQEYAFFNSMSPGMDVYDAYKNNKLRIWTSSLVYRKDFIENFNLRFLEDAYAMEDLNFIFKSLWNSTKIKVIKDSLSYYYQRPDSLTNAADFTFNKTVVNSIEDLIELSRKRVYGIDFERGISREFAIEHIMYQLFACTNSNNKAEILEFLEGKKVKEFLDEGVRKTTRYGRSMFIWSKIAAYAPKLFIFLYLKKSKK
ncbi:glycosyltransferase family A protein [uncultured Clostridium sp.]|uniref:glycosyltransferase family 2 protein n=1 Tax=uncultured Clostridium sp. TaxID=59620 RepID=UPI002603F4E5|nr:glycosyltransferase family A protein [uncultured Clostridium sp.]